VAHDLTEPRSVGPATRRFGSFLGQLVYTMEQRQTYLEKQLAAARRVPVHHVHLQPELPMGVWEFDRALELFEPGYLLMSRYLSAHEELGASPEPGRESWWRQAWSALTGGVSPRRGTTPSARHRGD
jgi:hypothetical protein